MNLAGKTWSPIQFTGRPLRQEMVDAQLPLGKQYDKWILMMNIEYLIDSSSRGP